MMAELAPPGFDNMVRYSAVVLLTGLTFLPRQVFRIIRAVKSRFVDDRTQRRPSDH